MRFQSTKPYRLRPASVSLVRNGLKFQSTKPYRLRHLQQNGRTISQYFNPRSRIGFDRYRLGQGTQKNYFNPRSRIGFDKFVGIYKTINFNFNPRSRIGFDDIPVGSLNPNLPFQSTKPYRLRPIIPIASLKSPRFQSTKPYRLRPAPLCSFSRFRTISIHEAV